MLTETDGTRYKEIQEDLMGLSEGICRVLVHPVRMLMIGINGDRETRKNRLTLVYLKNGH